MATPETNETRLSVAEKMIIAVLKDMRNNLSTYKAADIKALNQAWVQLNRITLRPDSDFS